MTSRYIAAISFLALLVAASSERRLKDADVVASQRVALLAWRDKFDEKAFLEDASMYAAMGPLASFTTKSPMILRGRADIARFWTEITAEIGLHSFKAFEDKGPLRSSALVVNDDEVIVSGSFTFDKMKGRILSQTWLRVAKDSWKIKSYMLAIDTLAKAVEVKVNKTAKEEVEITKDTKELLNGTLTASGAKQLEHDISDVSKVKKSDFDDTSASSTRYSYIVLPVSLLVCVAAAVFIKARGQDKHSFNNVSGPEYMLG